MPKRTRENNDSLTVETVPLDRLKPHPRNYQKHPDDQLEHIMQSLRDNGVYRNVVAAEDYTLLAGHGVVEAAKKLGMDHIEVRRLPLKPDDPKALKILAGDNEISNLADTDDRALTELLKELSDIDELLGTGFDKMMLSNLTMVTRPVDEIEDFDAAKEWVGMPEFKPGEKPFMIWIACKTEEDRKIFLQSIGAESKYIIETSNPSGGNSKISLKWPLMEREDLSSVRIEEEP